MENTLIRSRIFMAVMLVKPLMASIPMLVSVVVS